MNLKRYLLFAGAAYYPSGGWEDFVKSFDTVEQAEDEVKSQQKADPTWCSWYHIVDTETGEIMP